MVDPHSRSVGLMAALGLEPAFVLGAYPSNNLVDLEYLIYEVWHSKERFRIKKMWKSLVC